MNRFMILMVALMISGSRLLGAAEGDVKSVKLRVVAINPSEEKSQVVPIKIYLPKEVIPDDIIDMGELKVGYDSTKSLYYAFNDKIELAPLETKVFEVQLEDVWQVKEEEMNKIKAQTDRALKYFQNTEYFERADFIIKSIQKRLEGIATTQSDDTVSREEHIGIYRTNMQIMADIKEDIKELEKLLQHTGAPPSIEFLKDTVFEEKKNLDRITAWKLILGIIAFLGLLGIGFYFRWFMLVQNRRSAPMKSTEGGAGVVSISELAEDAPAKQETENQG